MSTTTVSPATVTLERVTRFSELLCRLGLDELFEPERQLQAVKGKPAKSMGEVEGEVAAAMTLHIGRFLREAGAGMLYDLATIVFDVDEEGAKQLTADDMRSGMRHFMPRAVELLLLPATFDLESPSGADGAADDQ